MKQLYGILNTLNAEANRKSTDNMQHMTAEMHDIAVKTKQETISMRIITFVTLCFLPGTFISVGTFLVCSIIAALHPLNAANLNCQTLMSTDIIHFPKAEAGPYESKFSLGALELYLVISLPLVIVTLAGWYLFYLWEIRRRDLSPWQRTLGRWQKHLMRFRKWLGNPCPPILPVYCD